MMPTGVPPKLFWHWAIAAFDTAVCLVKSTPPEAEALAARIYAMLPRIRVTDLLSEVAGWTLLTDCFTHLRSGETSATRAS